MEIDLGWYWYRWIPKTWTGAHKQNADWLREATVAVV